MIKNPRCRSRSKSVNDNPLPLPPDCVRRTVSGLLSIDLFGETGNFAGSGLFVKHPFFCRFINGGLGCVELLNGIFRILSHGKAHILDNVFYPSLNCFVPQAPTFILTGAFQC